MTKQIRSLPPGVDSIDQDVVFGTMWIKVGTLKLIRTSNAAFNVLCQFWGETSPSVLTTRFDTPNNQQQRTQRYNIKCPITFFIDYLQQMKNNLRLDVEGVGKVSLDVSKFIKKKQNYIYVSVTIDSRQAFDNFKGFFQVIGKGNRKAGSLEIQMGCDFDPTIALKQLGESGIQQIRKSEVLNCPAQKLQVKMCCGHCQCVCPKPPPRVKFINKKQNIKQDDPRIAHSLDTKPRQDSSFDANKYRSEKEETMQIENIRKQIKNKEQQKTMGAEIKKQNKQSQIKRQRQEKQKNEEIKKLEQFPEVPKILTYSNLRLNYEDEELKKHLQSQKEESIIERKWSDNFLEKSDPNNQMPLKKTFSNQSRQNREQDLGRREQDNKHKPKISPIEESDPLFQIKAKPEISKQALLQQFYGPNSSPFKFHEQAREKSGENFMRYHDKSEQDKLSRVINLNQELNFNKIGPPPLLTDSNEVRILPPDPNFRRTPFVTNTEQAFFADPPFINDGRLRTKTKATRSKLMLSLFIEITKNSVTLPIKEPFIIAYRPYGKKERLTLGPNFGDKIQILNIVGENEIRKMGKTPFIVEFWSSSQNKFLGLIRIDLNKIKQGFLLQDQLNQMAIKTNILPTTILKGKNGIHDLSDNEIGHCMLYCAIGTQNQLNTYLNQKQNTSLPINTPKSGENSKKIEDPEKQEQKQNNVIEEKNIASNYDTLLEQLYRNNSRLIDNLNRLMNQQFVTRAEMSELANNIGFGSIQSIYQLHRSVENDQSQSSTVDFHRIADSFDDYIEVLQIIRQQFTNCSKTIRNLFQDPNSVCSQLRQSSPTQIIPKKKAIQLYKRQTRFHEPIEDYFGKLNQYINIEILCANLQGRVLDTPELSQLSRDYFNNVVNRRIFQKIGANAMKVFDRIQQSNQNKSVIGLKEIYGAFQGKISLWLLLHLFEVVNKKNKMGSGDTVIFDQLKEHWIQFQNLRIQNQQIQKKPSKPEEQKVPSPRQPSPRPLPQHEPYQQQQQKPQPQIIQQKQPHKQPEKPEQPQIEPKPQPNQQPEQIEQPQQPRLFKHLFSIQPSELSLDHPLRGNCVVVYEFPFEEEQVKSKTFATAVDKHKYGLKMYGTHGFTIQEDVRNYIGDNGLKFYVIIDKKVQFEGALPSDELLIEANTEEDKIIPLFCDRTQGIAGKIKLNINYEKAAASENMLGKETTYQLFLPKSGHLNYSIICQHQQSKIRSQLNLKQQFYVALVLDMFHSNPNLRSQFPPISSKLYADSSQSIQLAGSIKLSLNPVILQYIKSANSRLTLNVIYYSKDSGNFERKQLPFASIQLPLINVIKAEGIKGEYAFKNKLGMFVTLANCRLKYDKDAIHKFGIKQTGNDKLSTSFWLILNFLQFMNFDVHRFTWIKMQFVIKSKKYSTQKLQLQPYSINFLHNAAILIKLTQQQFVDTKIIPVTIITNNSQKLAIDINLKSFSKDLIHRKYSIHNQTYIVVNQASKATKMRIAMKSYCFRGGPLLGNFVNSLYQHLDTEVIQDQMPEHTQNYEQMLDIFKNNLKLTQKGLQQALSQLDLIRNKQKLNFEFFTNRTYYKLDYTPILAQSEADIDFICQQLPTQADKQQVIQYLNQNNIRLQNFRPEFLDRFSFRQLNRSRADKNVEFLGIQNYVDLISFVRKIKLLGQQQNSNLHNQTSMQQKLVEMTILEGINFQQLYNGIKPNSLIRIPDLGIQTQVSHRNSNPYFNEIISVQLDKENITMLRNLKFQVYHCTADDDDAENILIGEGYLNLNIQQLKQSGKILKLTIGSVMSHKMKANLNIKVALVDGKHTKSRFGRSKLDESSQRVEDSADVSRFGDIIQNIKHEMAYKNKLFESSDQD